ncbi:MAG: toxin-antitoxin system YwqK family antitoxin [Bacteroidales bacterium]|nr:toxin-antitoxin system YwqK family antitoxin [Bacteroidales bacterium]
MTRQEQLEFCKKCKHREFNSNQGIICSLTTRVADFDDSCSSFLMDETIRNQPVKTMVDETPVSIDEAMGKLDETAIEKLRFHQDFNYAIIGGILAALVSAALWAIITVATKYQIGYMAIGVGILVGFGIRFFGSGIDKKFGFLGAVLAVLGCLTGNLLSQIGFYAEEQSMGFLEVLKLLDFTYIPAILAESFSPMDLLFYGIAVYAGYRFAFRQLTPALLTSLNSGESDGQPSYNRIRLPLVIAGIFALLLVVFMVSRGVSGPKSYNYESGNLMSKGILKNSKEHGVWTTFYENGQKMVEGAYDMGKETGEWKWYDENGNMVKKGNYLNGIEHGEWITYYPGGAISDSGGYQHSRVHGYWVYRYESGSVLQEANFKNNMRDGQWNAFYENGQMMSSGLMKEDLPVGKWLYYYPDGHLSEELNYRSGGKVSILNVFDKEGNHLVVNGNGTYKTFFEEGQILQSGEVKNGIKTGNWKSFYADGDIREEGEFENEIYMLVNSWNPEGKKDVSNGNGVYYSYQPGDSTLYEAGEIKNGLRNGLWSTYYAGSGNILQESSYIDGKLSGSQKSYFESGQLNLEGEMLNDLREGEWTWYYQNGIVCSTASFKHNKKDGVQLIWSESGEKSRREKYQEGKLIEEKAL